MYIAFVDPVVSKPDRGDRFVGDRGTSASGKDGGMCVSEIDSSAVVRSDLVAGRRRLAGRGASKVWEQRLFAGEDRLRLQGI